MVENLADLPQVDSSGKEWRIYDADGIKIPRRQAKPLEPGEEYTWAGLLMDVRGIDSLFVRQEGKAVRVSDEVDSEDEVEAEVAAATGPGLDVYPQAFTNRWGHFQADCLMHHFDEPIKRINNEHLVNDLDGQGHCILVTPDSCQGYNELSHRTAPRAGGQDVQKGLITAAIMRGAGLTPAEQVKTDQWRASCIGSLPHARMREKISHPDSPRGFRIEHVYNVDMWAIPVAEQDGRCSFRELTRTDSRG